MFYEFSIRLRQFMENLSIGKIHVAKHSSFFNSTQKITYT